MDKPLTGAAGEHHVMAELLRRGYIAALTPRGAPNADIVVSDVEGSRLCAIQVKARRDITASASDGWPMNAKHENICAERLFYVFVDFGRSVEAQPEVFVMPAADVADYLTDDHQKWLATPGRSGRQHQNTDMRLLPRNTGWIDQYRNAWHLLGLEAETLVEATNVNEMNNRRRRVRSPRRPARVSNR